MRRLAILAAAAVIASQAAIAGTIERVHETGIFRIGYRADAKPYSYQDARGRPAGYVVDLCREVAAALGPRRAHRIRAGARRRALPVGA